MSLKSRPFWIAWGPALTWAAVLFFLSELRGLPSGLERFAELNDKVVHVLLYTALGMTLAWARRVTSVGRGTPARHATEGRSATRRRIPHAVLLIAGYAYGALDEWHQSFVPGRTPDVMDFFADVAGVTIGYLLFHGMWAMFFRRGAHPSFLFDWEQAGIAHRDPERTAPDLGPVEHDTTSNPGTSPHRDQRQRHGT